MMPLAMLEGIDPGVTAQGVASVWAVGGPVVGFILFVLIMAVIYVKFVLPAQERKDKATLDMLERQSTNSLGLVERQSTTHTEQINRALDQQAMHNERLAGGLEKANELTRTALERLADRDSRG